jgi:hypothetical protein
MNNLPIRSFRQQKSRTYLFRRPQVPSTTPKTAIRMEQHQSHYLDTKPDLIHVQRSSESPPQAHHFLQGLPCQEFGKQPPNTYEMSCAALSPYISTPTPNTHTYVYDLTPPDSHGDHAHNLQPVCNFAAVEQATIPGQHASSMRPYSLPGVPGGTTSIGCLSEHGILLPSDGRVQVPMLSAQSYAFGSPVMDKGRYPDVATDYVSPTPSSFPLPQCIGSMRFVLGPVDTPDTNLQPHNDHLHSNSKLKIHMHQNHTFIPSKSSAVGGTDTVQMRNTRRRASRYQVGSGRAEKYNHWLDRRTRTSGALGLSDYRAMSLRELREILKARGLKVRGLKEDVCLRLFDDDRSAVPHYFRNAPRH